MKDEASYVCESCGEEIVVPIDLTAGSRQEYVEDCPVCCCPNLIHVEVDEDGDVRAWAERSNVLPLYQDPWFTFRFADDRIIPRFHLEGAEAGRRISVFKIDPGIGEWLGLLATATVPFYLLSTVIPVAIPTTKLSSSRADICRTTSIPVFKSKSLPSLPSMTTLAYVATGTCSAVIWASGR